MKQRKFEFRREPFMRGFWQGMAAPLMLFDDPPQRELPAMLEIQPLNVSVTASTANAWARVGELMREAARRVRQERGEP